MGTGMGDTGMGDTGMGNTGMGDTGMGNGMGDTGMGNTGMGDTGMGRGMGTGMGTGMGGVNGLCKYPHYQGDGYCDDDNNNQGCFYDGGDCCGDNVLEYFCKECLCLDPNSHTGMGNPDLWPTGTGDLFFTEL